MVAKAHSPDDVPKMHTHTTSSMSMLHTPPPTAAPAVGSDCDGCSAVRLRRAFRTSASARFPTRMLKHRLRAVAHIAIEVVFVEYAFGCSCIRGEHILLYYIQCGNESVLCVSRECVAGVAGGRWWLGFLLGGGGGMVVVYI